MRHYFSNVKAEFLWASVKLLSQFKIFNEFEFPAKTKISVFQKTTGHFN